MGWILIRYHLSPRLRGIGHLIARGKRNKEIAQELGLAENTVKRYIENMMDKVGIKSRTRAELAVWFYREFVATSFVPSGGASANASGRREKGAA